MTRLAVELHPVSIAMPELASDVLVFTADDPAGKIGAWVGHDIGGAPCWEQSDGTRLRRVIGWCAIPRWPAET